MVVIKSILRWKVLDTLQCQRHCHTSHLRDSVTAQCFNARYSPDRFIPLKLAQPVLHKEENLSSALPFSAASGRFYVGWGSGDKAGSYCLWRLQWGWGNFTASHSDDLSCRCLNDFQTTGFDLSEPWLPMGCEISSNMISCNSLSSSHLTSFK